MTLLDRQSRQSPGERRPIPARSRPLASISSPTVPRDRMKPPHVRHELPTSRDHQPPCVVRACGGPSTLLDRGRMGRPPLRQLGLMAGV